MLCPPFPFPIDACPRFPDGSLRPAASGRPGPTDNFTAVIGRFVKISFFFLSQIPTTKTQKYLKKKNVVEDVSLSLRKEQLSKPKDFLPKPTENCREREKPVQKSQFGCCQPFF